MAWAPKYGLKGIIDASLRVKFESSASETFEKIMPLEFKTGKATTGQARVLVTENFLTDASIILCLFAFLSFFYAPS